MRVPNTASPEVQQALREVWAAIDRLGATGALNQDLKGKRVINASDGVDPGDYVTRRQMAAVQREAQSLDLLLQSLVVNGPATFRGPVVLPRLTDHSAHHGIVYVDSNGKLAINEDGQYALDLNLALGHLELGYDLLIHWITGRSTIGSPADGVITFGNNAATGFSRLVLGPVDTNAHPALVKNAATFEMRVGGGGALTTLLLAILNATTVNATTVNATTVNATTVNAANVPTTGSDPTFGDVTADRFIATGAQTYAPTIGGTRRTFDSTTVTLEELAEVVGTLIGDFDGIGLVNA